MAIIFEKNNEEDRVIVWQQEETDDDLRTDVEKMIASGEIPETKNLSLNTHRFIIRKILHSITGTDTSIEYNQFGKPTLNNSDLNISVSHSGSRVAIMLSPFYAGIDVQIIRPKILKIKEKFIGLNETQWIDPAMSFDYYHIIWSAKEAIYKALSVSGLSFKEDIEVFHFELMQRGNLKATTNTISGNIHFNCYYEKMNDYFLVYVLNK